MTDYNAIIGEPGQEPHYNLWVSGWTAVQELDNEISGGRGTYGTLALRFVDTIHYSVGLTQNLDGNGKRGVNFADPVDSQDVATKAHVSSVVELGGDPANIPITSLGSAWFFVGD
ncbi:MAG: hypothetical protein GY862_17735 [Gammaproteobacteria bacterium]|nr:hypothetical protein [Gammaproteobacteria bacterium]